MNHRIFVEKKSRFRVEADTLRAELNAALGLSLGELRLISVYDLFGFSSDLLEEALSGVFADPVTDYVTDHLSLRDMSYIAVEPLPGQFDSRSAAVIDCIRVLHPDMHVECRSARIILLHGAVGADTLERIRSYVINPVDSREKDMSELKLPAAVTSAPATRLVGFCDMSADHCASFCKDYSLAMSAADLQCVVEYFRGQGRDPYLAELIVLDTYWSDHCRHTTFNARIKSIKIDESFIKNDILHTLDIYRDMRSSLSHDGDCASLMDLATIGARYLQKKGLLADIDADGENNACGIVSEVEVDGEKQKWIVFFKNETHNHPTEIEPYGGAATCLGGAIRDPLSERAYVYQALRLSGAADIFAPASAALEGRLPQRIISLNAAHGYSDYGNRIGVPTSCVREIYHPGYEAKRLELGAVVGAVRSDCVTRISPSPGDVVLLIGGRTGRDGVGGATGSSKSHDAASLSSCSCEVQKGNPVEERKLQRLFRRPEVTRIIKRANDFGAGGVAVAVGELAAGIDIYLDRMPVKYEGLNVIELAVSESQERMAVVVSPSDMDKFMSYCAEENIEAVHVADVSDSGRMRMFYEGSVVVDLERRFIDTAGAGRVVDAEISHVDAVNPFRRSISGSSFAERFENNLADVNVLSQIGLSEMFDSSIGRGTVLAPYGGMLRRSEVQTSVHKLPVGGFTTSATMVAYGFNPFLSEWSPYHGAAYAVVDMCAKVAAAGGDFSSLRLSFQEYFEHMSAPVSWGKPLAALLGALRMQHDLSLPAVGGKDSMSGSFQDMHVPPALIAFGFNMVDVRSVISTDFKRAGDYVYLLRHSCRDNYMPDSAMLISNFNAFHKLVLAGKVTAAYAVGYGGVAEALSKMSFGSDVGADVHLSEPELFDSAYGSVLFTASSPVSVDNADLLGVTIADPELRVNGTVFGIDHLFGINTAGFSSVYPASSLRRDVGDDVMLSVPKASPLRKYCYPGDAVCHPVVYVPVFPGTNCEYDLAESFRSAGAEVRFSVFRNLSGSDVSASISDMVRNIDECHIFALAGGFSEGDEPDGAAKFIVAVLKNADVSAAISRLIARKGLILGICNGFQALVRSGLLPFGRLDGIGHDQPVLFRNSIGHHVSAMVETCVSSLSSPWLDGFSLGERHTIPVSHGEGRFIVDAELADRLFYGGQVAFQYCDLSGVPSMSSRFNPNGSDYAVEGLVSPDGLILGKMGHSERYEDGLFKNIYGERHQSIFDNAVRYFRKVNVK